VTFTLSDFFGAEEVSFGFFTGFFAAFDTGFEAFFFFVVFFFGKRTPAENMQLNYLNTSKKDDMESHDR